jgi:ribonuclease-3
VTLGDFQARLGYVFKDIALLREALTHASHGDLNYERLEFLGDRVLGLAVGSWLWERFLEADEGELSRRHTMLVRESTLVKVAVALDLERYIVFGNGEAKKDSILADAMEALLGAIFIDGGLLPVMGVVQREWAAMIDLKDEKDPKGRLQEWLQGQGWALPHYEVIEESGPDHNKHFKVMVQTEKGECLGEGRSKQAASADAAQNMMAVLEKMGH